MIGGRRPPCSCAKFSRMNQQKLVLHAACLCAASLLAAGMSAWAATPDIEFAAETDDYRVLPLVEIPGRPGARTRWQEPQKTYFGLSDRYLFATDKFLFVHLAVPDGVAQPADNGSANLLGRVGYAIGANRFSVPIVNQTYLTDDGTRRFEAYGLEWRRKFGVTHELALSARRGEHGALINGGAREVSVGNVAQIAWSSAFAGSYQPRVMGSVFLGDETAKDKGAKWFGRKYYGLSLDGSFTAFDRHTPYASLYLQRSDYDTTETLMQARREDYSRLAAGWDWQLRPNWGLRAEANYILNTSGLPGYDYERSKLLFSTRFDFK